MRFTVIYDLCLRRVCIVICVILNMMYDLDNFVILHTFICVEICIHDILNKKLLLVDTLKFIKQY